MTASTDVLKSLESNPELYTLYSDVLLSSSLPSYLLLLKLYSLRETGDSDELKQYRLKLAIECADLFHLDSILQTIGVGYKRDDKFVGYSIIITEEAQYQIKIRGTEQFINKFKQLKTDDHKKKFFNYFESVPSISYSDVAHLDVCPQWTRYILHPGEEGDSQIAFDSGWTTEDKNPFLNITKIIPRNQND